MMKNKGGYFVDSRLKQRVKQYLSSCQSKYVDIGGLARDLQKLYSIDYGRRKRNAFRIQVEKVYNIICREKGDEDLMSLEDKYILKRTRQGHENDGEEGSTEESSDSEDYPEYPPINHMNSSLTSLYRKGNPVSASAGVPKDETVDAKIALSVPGKMPEIPRTTPKMPKQNWFIDKTPGKKEDDCILIDICNEDRPGSQSPQRSGDTSKLESSKRKEEKKNKGKLKKRRQMEETQNTDGEIESAIMNQKVKSRAAELQYSSLRFEDVGGIEETLKEVCKMMLHMRHPEVYQQLGVVPPRGFLLHGPPGCGKTLLAQAVAGELELPMLKVAATEMVSGVSGDSEQKLRELFVQAVSSSPCILFIDEIDSITPKREIASKDMERRIVAQLLTCMDDLNTVNATAQVLVIGATNRPDSLDPALRRAGRFDREICLGIPDQGARERILRTLCRKLKLSDDFDFCHLAHVTPGYVGADLMAMCREAAMRAVSRALAQLQDKTAEERSTECSKNERSMEVESDVEKLHPAEDELQRLLRLLKETSPVSEEELRKLCITMEDFITSLSSVQPSAKREGFATVPDVTWADIGALEEIREELTMAILAPVRNPAQFNALGLTAPAGVLLAGPPGCGKTLLAKAVANESGLNFISVKGPELLNMYVGESERAVRQVFQRASNSAPCVIFFDEIDALCPRRSGHESGASIRVVNQLLTEMDGLEARKQVFIMAATNRPDIIDPAILRPGRLDKTLYVGLPTPLDRFAILKTITKCGTRPPLDADVNLETIACSEHCECYTGADLSALVREASVIALKQQLSLWYPDSSKGSSNRITVSQQHFEEAFKKVKPSVSKKDQIMYEKLRLSLG